MGGWVRSFPKTTRGLHSGDGGTSAIGRHDAPVRRSPLAKLPFGSIQIGLTSPIFDFSARGAARAPSGPALGVESAAPKADGVACSHTLSDRRNVFQDVTVDFGAHPVQPDRAHAALRRAPVLGSTESRLDSRQSAARFHTSHPWRSSILPTTLREHPVHGRATVRAQGPLHPPHPDHSIARAHPHSLVRCSPPGAHAYAHADERPLRLALARRPRGSTAMLRHAVGER